MVTINNMGNGNIEFFLSRHGIQPTYSGGVREQKMFRYHQFE